MFHMLAAVAWIGSMIYNEFAVKPALKPLGNVKAHLIYSTGIKKFSVLTWSSLAILLFTGSYKVYQKQRELTPFLVKLPGIILALKLILVAVLIIILVLQRYFDAPPIGNLVSLFRSGNPGNQTELMKDSYIANVLSKISLYAGGLIIILSVILSGLIKEGH